MSVRQKVFRSALPGDFSVYCAGKSVLELDSPGSARIEPLAGQLLAFSARRIALRPVDDLDADISSIVERERPAVSAGGTTLGKPCNGLTKTSRS